MANLRGLGWSSQLLRWVAGAGFDFFNLLSVAFAVCADEENKFLGVPFSVAARTVHSVPAQIRRGLQKLFCFRAAFHEMFDRSFR